MVPCCALWKKNVHGHLKIFFRLNSDAFVQYNTLGALWNNAIQTLQLINTENLSFLPYHFYCIVGLISVICRLTQIKMYSWLHYHYQDHSLLFSCIEILHQIEITCNLNKNQGRKILPQQVLFQTVNLSMHTSDKCQTKCTVSHVYQFQSGCNKEISEDITDNEHI